MARPTDESIVIDCERQQAELESRSDRLSKVLATESVDDLLSDLDDQMTRCGLRLRRLSTTLRGGEFPLPEREQADIDDTLALGSELCRRGIAPVWRNTPWYCGSQDDKSPWWRDKSADLLALALDVQWIACRWPKHRPAWQRAEGVFNPRTLWPALKFLYHDGRRTPGQLVMALALAPDQQIELCHARSIGVSKRVCWMWRHQAEAREQIATQVHVRDLRSEDERSATVDRRHATWMAGHLAGGKPTRMAELLALRPDAGTMRRSTVARDWAKVCDLCQSDPRPKAHKGG